MIVETGHYALVLALALALINAVLPLWGTFTRDVRLMAVTPSVALMQCAFVVLAYGALTYAHIVSDFSLVNVVENSHSAKPLIYKISGVWGNHEGSMLLWVLVLALFGGAVAFFSRSMPADLRACVLAVQAWIGSAFLLFILLTSNPFARLAAPPIEGNDLNPLLQDPGLAIHPPLLYFGYVGLSITFSFAAGALICGRIDALWARTVRPWILIAWIALTLGIAMGSYWAYYTLGWGGFWFWDPVENASLMPWLAATALLHSAAVMEKRDALKIWTIFLAILAFSFSLIGTFLVRSGVLTSVHAFASDPRRGIFILAILVFFIGGSLTLFAWRAPILKQGGLFAPISREAALVINNLLLTTACATVFVGTLYPLALEALTGEKISVGAPFFNATFVPLSIPLFLLIPFGQSLAWKRGDLYGVAQRLAFAILCGLGFMLLVALWHGGPVLSVIMAGLALFTIIGSFTDLALRLFGHTAAGSEIWARLRGLPRSAFGTAFAHAGLGVTLLGLAATGWGAERIAHMKVGETVDVGGYELTLTELTPRQGPNYTELVGRTSVRSGGIEKAVIEPSQRFFPARRSSRAEAGIVTLGLGQVYMSIAEQSPDGGVNVRMFWKPLVILIWIGALIMGFGGLLSLSDRRLRLGLARRTAALRQGRPQPAE
ncbi:heme lyase CcmF/NrfE family subunit [Beijerinckia indica]|uniref:Cytochrome c-type biogenesis protein CcmF n=1 Tax=Beijerinckia indica subsp. indica (strain ATCC 9039 / DSM 1715 / NCIMB 8712) TaxID=395963 RepID=B2IGT9_BEII9|nr:heme lyase CcmF/NrfE family subunit [Beijerinckia indica]ACB95850.1 cytochrome c-type biogenesis protein CcmF [Beijerinckia indica subsp. indica ATCC 9039]